MPRQSDSSMGSQSSKQARQAKDREWWDLTTRLQKEFNEAFCSFDDPGAYLPTDVYVAALLKYTVLRAGVSASCARDCLDRHWRCNTNDMHAVSSLSTGKFNVLVGVKLIAFPTEKTVIKE